MELVPVLAFAGTFALGIAIPLLFNIKLGREVIVFRGNYVARLRDGPWKSFQYKIFFDEAHNATNVATLNKPAKPLHVFRGRDSESNEVDFIWYAIQLNETTEDAPGFEAIVAWDLTILTKEGQSVTGTFGTVWQRYDNARDWSSDGVEHTLTVTKFFGFTDVVPERIVITNKPQTSGHAQRDVRIHGRRR